MVSINTDCASDSTVGGREILPEYYFSQTKRAGIQACDVLYIGIEI